VAHRPHRPASSRRPSAAYPPPGSTGTHELFVRRSWVRMCLSTEYCDFADACETSYEGWHCAPPGPCPSLTADLRL
jgi:hypothetical protein